MTGFFVMSDLGMTLFYESVRVSGFFFFLTFSFLGQVLLFVKKKNKIKRYIYIKHQR